MSEILGGVTKRTKSFIAEDLQRRLSEFSKKPIISGALVIDAAHAYWWYVEFGAASQFVGDAGSGLQKPPGIASVQGRVGRYRIDRGDATGVYKSGPLRGRIYKKKLRFKQAGKIVYRDFV